MKYLTRYIAVIFVTQFITACVTYPGDQYSYCDIRGDTFCIGFDNALNIEARVTLGPDFNAFSIYEVREDNNFNETLVATILESQHKEYYSDDNEDLTQITTIIDGEKVTLVKARNEEKELIELYIKRKKQFIGNSSFDNLFITYDPEFSNSFMEHIKLCSSQGSSLKCD